MSQQYRRPDLRVLVATLQGPGDHRKDLVTIAPAISEYARAEFVQLAAGELGLFAGSMFRTYEELKPILEKRDLNLWTRMAVDLRRGLPLANDGGELVYGEPYIGDRGPVAQRRARRERLEAYVRTRGFSLSWHMFVAATQSVDGDTVTVIGHVPQHLTMRMIPMTQPAETALVLDMGLFHELATEIAACEDERVQIDPPVAVVFELGNDMYGVMYRDDHDSESVRVAVVGGSYS